MSRKICFGLFVTFFILAFLVTLTSAVPKADAANAVNPISRLEPGVSPAIPKVQTDINGPAGSGAFGKTVTALPNGNFVVTDPNYSIPLGAANVGAVHLFNGATLALISTLTGGTASDLVSNGGVVVLANGNYVVVSPLWDNPSGSIADVGAVTWCSASTGCGGLVSASNSLIGGTVGDDVGNGSVVALANGNYVVTSLVWDNPSGPKVDAGAVTWGNGASGTFGAVSSGNSLVGGTGSDQVGSGGITKLSNGNFVVSSPNWDNPAGPVANVGAVTWGNGSSGTAGTVSSGNSLIGGTNSDTIGSNSVTALTNGHYVVSSPFWDNPAGSKSDAGAVTWGNGSGGTVGAVASSNSLVGGSNDDNVGNNGFATPGVTALTNGHYVVSSVYWDDIAGAVLNAGAATWGNGGGGTVGLITSGNSLIGGTASDQVSFGGITRLTNGNYVVISALWDNPIGPIANAGAATWGNGSSGTVGLITSSNSLIGGTGSDTVGNAGVTALTNGNYVVASPNWDNPTGPVVNVGAATWGNGSIGTVGVVTSTNSLVGGRGNDSITGGGGGVTALTNGHYVVYSPFWDEPTVPKADVGAVTWGNGAGGTVGLVTSGNSLIGGTISDNIGNLGVTGLTNGNYVVTSSIWDNPTGPKVDAGAVTWGNGSGGTVGVVTSINSLVGGTLSDNVGNAGVTPLTNGNYVVRSSHWDDPAGPIFGAGAATWGNGLGGTVGLVTTSNSLVGGTGSDQIGIGRVNALSNGHYVVESSFWDNPSGPVADARAVTLGNGNGGTVGLLTSANSIMGTAGAAVNNVPGFTYDAVHRRLVVGRSAGNIASVFDCSICTDSRLFLPLTLR